MSDGVLVSGANRSGTTWVGRMIEASPEYFYIDEPFNPSHRLGILNKKIDEWFLYINSNNSNEYRDAFKSMLEFKYNLAAELGQIRSPRDVARLVRDWNRTVNAARSSQKPLLKDPIALFSSEWLAREFDMKVIIMIRHPAAYVNSIINAGWHHPFEHFKRQGQLLDDILNEYADEIDIFARDEQPLIEQAILLWNIIYSTVSKFQENHDNWLFIRHEDISAAPIQKFQEMFDYLDSPFTDEIETHIRSHSSSANPSKTDTWNTIALDSRQNILRWKSELGAEEIDLIRGKTESVWTGFYHDSDWG